MYQEGGIVSRDGHCRTFDAEATGDGWFGHGVGVVVLKRLDEAVRDGDRIAAVIRGFAVNNDGSAKAGYMAPGGGRAGPSDRGGAGDGGDWTRDDYLCGGAWDGHAAGRSGGDRGIDAGVSRRYGG